MKKGNEILYLGTLYAGGGWVDLAKGNTSVRGVGSVTVLWPFINSLDEQWSKFLVEEAELRRLEAAEKKQLEDAAQKLISDRSNALQNNTFYKDESACHSIGIEAELQGLIEGKWVSISGAKGWDKNPNCPTTHPVQPWTFVELREGLELRWRFWIPNQWDLNGASFRAKLTTESKSAAELRAKQEAEAKAAAELKAKQEAEAAAAAKAAAELKAKLEAEAKAIADAAAQKVIQDDFNAVTSSYQKLLLRIYDLKIKFPRVSNLLGTEEKLLRLPIILGSDLSTAKYNIQSVNASLDTSEKVWEKTQKTTITCVKGQFTKKVTAVKPKCPAGYKKKL